MELLGLVVPFVAAGGWLWWIYSTDRFEREPWPLVLKTFGIGAAAGLLGLLALFVLILLIPEGSDLTLLVFPALVPVHLGALAAVLYRWPYRTYDWNDPFDGIVYGGAAGIGYGTTYTLFYLLGSPLAGFRSAMFTIPTFMLTGLIMGHYMSQVRFGPPDRARAMRVKVFWVAGLYLAGLELARALGGELMGSEHPLASAVVYAVNTLGWVVAMHALDAQNRASVYNPENYRLWLAPTGCPHCGYAHPMGANYCNWCGSPIAAHQQQGVQG
ncbi:MAG TPA: zinc ribbon domain-containing protein [Symbiobacteriaceae bacterium]|nr:zinc ribbon domain-containing protein [Symbiobacteriaceae bacterium]